MSKPETSAPRKPQVTIARATPAQPRPVIPGGVRRAPLDCELTEEQFGVLCAVASVQEMHVFGARLSELEPATGLQPSQVVLALTSMSASIVADPANPRRPLIEKIALPQGGAGARLTQAGWDLLRTTTH